MHNLTPIYKPCGWTVNPVEEIPDTPENRELERKLGEAMRAAMYGRLESNFTTSLPVKRNRVAEEMGDEYLPAPTIDQLRFEIAFLTA